MADLTFKTYDLANAYLHGVGVAVDPGGWLLDFRTRTGSTDMITDLASLDQRIAAFQNIISDGAKAGSEEFPYDAAFLKREFMNEVLASLLKRGGYFVQNITYYYAGQWASTPVVDYSTGLIGGRTLYEAVPQTIGPLTVYTQGQMLWDGNNFDNMTVTQQKNALSDAGKYVYDAYSTWIDAVFAEGNKMKNIPADPATNASVVTKLTTSITERIIDGVTYDRVSYDGARYYLISKDAQTYTAEKQAVTGYRAYYDPNASDPDHSDRLVATSSAEARIGLSPGTMATAIYLEVDKNLNPVSGAEIAAAQRNMSPAMYLYYWCEARIKILRGQLNMKEAVTSEIRDDLAKANAAYADLEKQAGLTRAQSADGKVVNPDTSSETFTMDYFEATNAKKGTMMYDNNGNDDMNTYSEWGSGRSSLKAYIDRKSTQSQDAMLDYQTTLNRFNQAYEVMSKLQEKMDGLVKSQLRNVS